MTNRSDRGSQEPATCQAPFEREAMIWAAIFGSHQGQGPTSRSKAVHMTAPDQGQKSSKPLQRRRRPHMTTGGVRGGRWGCANVFVTFVPPSCPLCPSSFQRQPLTRDV